jgi:threonine/homoserine/homoserine lactone efflux protein
MSDSELRTKRLRQHDLLWLGAGCFAAAQFAVMSLILPGQGWPSFGAFMLCLVAVGWWISRRREAQDSNQPKPAVDPVEKMMRGARRVAVVNGAMLVIGGALFSLFPLTDPDYPVWLRIVFSLVVLVSISGAGCASVYWGLRKSVKRISSD